jgi:hypothetical protein
VASITTWTRLEPRARSAAMRASLEAQLADPLWMLGRQWQMLEFAGHDGGSAVQARLRAESSPVSRWLPGTPAQGSTGRRLTPLAEPLEEIIEREGARAPSKAGIRQAADAGLAFLRLLGDAGLAGEYAADYLTKYPIARPTPAQRMTLDPATQRLLDVVATRAPHGGKLYADLDDALRPASGAGALPSDPAIDPGDDTDKITAIARSWLEWYDDILAPHTGAEQPWAPERLEYEFAVGARTSTGQAVLTASGHRGGELDWHAFDLHPTAGLGTGGDPQPTSMVRTVIPAPIRYRGMPQPRFWEFEDELTNIGAVEAAADDLGRMLLIEFALVYGNDHYVIPIDLDVGSVCEVNSLVVTDSFGERTLVRSARDVDGPTGAWAMFELSLDRRAGSPAPQPSKLFFLPPTLGPNLEGDPIEDVLLIRDEMANLAWAIERSVEGGAGGSIDRFEAWQERRRRQEQAAETAEPGSTAPKTGELEYRLSSEVPEHWFPLLPVAVGTTEMALRLGDVATHPLGNVPLGRILEPYDAQMLIREEEVPRAGARVMRAYQYARWIDGSTHLWVGRRKRTGRGEGSSGLRWDVAEPGEASEA